MVNMAAQEVRPSEARVRSIQWPGVAAAAAALLLVLALVVWGPWPLDRWVTGEASGSAVAVADRENDNARRPELTKPGATEESAATPEPAANAPSERPQAFGGVAGPAGASSEAGQVLQPDWLEQQHRRAWLGLAELWGDADRAEAIRAACDGAPRTGFGCTRNAGSWARIRQLGLPVVLVMQDEQPRFVLLAGIRTGELLLGSAADRRAVLRDTVEAQWLGEYYVAWPQAPDWPVQIQRGETGPAVEIVMEMAALAQPGWSGGGVFDENFEAWLMAFQRRNGLVADGIVGPNTLIHLMAPTITEPRLVTEATENS
jgi:peptidoglycan hydrolase-like protein with peptidoglycan-binding domain